MRQARIIDIHEYYRTGGIDWLRLKANFDAVGIRALVGSVVDELLEEHVDYAQRYEIPYFTYCVPSKKVNAEKQAALYLDQYGVKDAPKVWDIEPVGGELVDGETVSILFQCVQDAWYYSNENYTNKIGNPKFLKDVEVIWLAQYYYQIYPLKYRKFKPFLDKYAWQQPKSAVRLGLNATLWQFTNYGDARYYCANERTNDPDWPAGIKSADLNVSLIDEPDLLALFNDAPLTIEEKVERLWDAHPDLHG
ncbi:MAG: hypothetical protein ACK2U1_06600 [Anaerolineales bacterium]